MTEAFREPILPRVTDDDLSQILFEDVTDPTHIVRWIDFAKTNPELARELLSRAYGDMSTAENDAERVKIALDLLSYAVRALEAAGRRRPSGETIDGANRRPLA